MVQDKPPLDRRGATQGQPDSVLEVVEHTGTVQSGEVAGLSDQEQRPWNPVHHHVYHKLGDMDRQLRVTPTHLTTAGL